MTVRDQPVVALRSRSLRDADATLLQMTTPGSGVTMQDELIINHGFTPMIATCRRAVECLLIFIVRFQLGLSACPLPDGNEQVPQQRTGTNFPTAGGSDRSRYLYYLEGGGNEGNVKENWGTGHCG